MNITSVSAYTASVNRGDYCVSKAGLAMMTKLYAARLAEHGINVYEIRPGVIETDMTGPVKAKYDKLIFEQDLTPIRRWGKPDDVAARGGRDRDRPAAVQHRRSDQRRRRISPAPFVAFFT